MQTNKMMSLLYIIRAFTFSLFLFLPTIITIFFVNIY